MDVCDLGAIVLGFDGHADGEKAGAVNRDEPTCG